MPNILADHGLSVCDTVCSYFDIWKKTVINVLNKNNIDLSSVGFLNELLESYFKQRIDFILYCYGQNKVETLKIMNRKRCGSIILQRVNQVLLNWKIHHQLVTYLSSHFHLVDIIYQSSSIHFMHQLISPTHSFGHWFPSHSFYRSQSVLFTFSIFGFAHTASYFNLIVSFIFFNQSRLWKLGELGLSLDKI